MIIYKIECEGCNQITELKENKIIFSKRNKGIWDKFDGERLTFCSQECYDDFFKSKINNNNQNLIKKIDLIEIESKKQKEL